jgi:hypothetical protein
MASRRRHQLRDAISPPAAAPMNLTRFPAQIALRNLRKPDCDANRYPLRPKTRDDFSSIRHPALSFCLSMIFSENRYPFFRIML